MDDMYLVSVDGENYPIHDAVQQTGGFVVSETQFVVKEQGLDPMRAADELSEEYGVAVKVEPLTHELAAKFSKSGLEEHIAQYWAQ